MNQKAYKALEYYKIINMLNRQGILFRWKRNLAGRWSHPQILMKSDICRLTTRDALTRLFQKGNSFHLAGSQMYVRGSLKRLEIGSSLGIGELLAICSLLENTNRVKAYSRK